MDDTHSCYGLRQDAEESIYCDEDDIQILEEDLMQHLNDPTIEKTFILACCEKKCLNNNLNGIDAEILNLTHFFDWSGLNCFYKEVNGIQKGHIFTFNSENKGKVGVQSETIDSIEWVSILKNKISDVKDFKPEKMLQEKGYPAKKQVDMFKKLRPFVPEQYRDELCPIPPDEIISEVQNSDNLKRRNRTNLSKAQKKTSCVIK